MFNQSIRTSTSPLSFIISSCSESRRYYKCGRRWPSWVGSIERERWADPRLFRGSGRVIGETWRRSRRGPTSRWPAVCWACTSRRRRGASPTSGSRSLPKVRARFDFGDADFRLSLIDTIWFSARFPCKYRSGRVKDVAFLALGVPDPTRFIVLIHLILIHSVGKSGLFRPPTTMNWLPESDISSGAGGERRTEGDEVPQGNALELFPQRVGFGPAASEDVRSQLFAQTLLYQKKLFFCMIRCPQSIKSIL